MDEWCGDTSHLTTQDELSSTKCSHPFLAYDGRPTNGKKVQICTFLGQKCEEKMEALCL